MTEHWLEVDPAVVCVLYDGGGGYDATWVDKLYQGVLRHADGRPFRFICLVDRYYPFSSSTRVEAIPLTYPDEGWMCLLEAFRPDLSINHGIVLGLDTIIKGEISCLLDWRNGVGVLHSPMNHSTCCNAVLTFDRRWADVLWRRWVRNRPFWRDKCSRGLGPNQDGRPSEVIFLRHNYHPSWVYLDDLWPGYFASYKVHPYLVDEAAIVYFHGDPKPPHINPSLLQEWNYAR